MAESNFNFDTFYDSLAGTEELTKKPKAATPKNVDKFVPIEPIDKEGAQLKVQEILKSIEKIESKSTIDEDFGRLHYLDDLLIADKWQQENRPLYTTKEGGGPGTEDSHLRGTYAPISVGFNVQKGQVKGYVDKSQPGVEAGYDLTSGSMWADPSQSIFDEESFMKKYTGPLSYLRERGLTGGDSPFDQNTLSILEKYTNSPDIDPALAHKGREFLSLRNEVLKIVEDHGKMTDKKRWTKHRPLKTMLWGIPNLFGLSDRGMLRAPGLTGGDDRGSTFDEGGAPWLEWAGDPGTLTEMARHFTDETTADSWKDLDQMAKENPGKVAQTIKAYKKAYVDALPFMEATRGQYSKDITEYDVLKGQFLSDETHANPEWRDLNEQLYQYAKMLDIEITE